MAAAVCSGHGLQDQHPVVGGPEEPAGLLGPGRPAPLVMTLCRVWGPGPEGRPEELCFLSATTGPQREAAVPVPGNLALSCQNRE